MTSDPGALLHDLLQRHAPAADDRVAVWWGALDGTTWLEHDVDEVFVAASTMKVPLALAAHRRHGRGEIDLSARVAVHPDFDSLVAGRRFTLEEHDDQDPETWAEVGGTQTLDELLRRALVHSGNLATNLLLAEVGTAEVAAVLADAGCSDRTVLPRGISDLPAWEQGLVNEVTARDLARVLAATPEAVEHVLTAQTWRDAIPAGLPSGTHVASKSGWVDGIAHDVAIIRPDAGEPCVLVVLTELDRPTDEANALIAEIATLLWEHRR